MEFASKTPVSPERTKAEIETAVKRFGASSFVSGWDGNRASVQFRIRDRLVRFDLSLPDGSEQRFTHYKSQAKDGHLLMRQPDAIGPLVAQEVRSRWRALLLSIKARLSAVEAGIETFEAAFLPYVVLPGGRTVSSVVLPLVASAYETGAMPAGLLGAGDAP